MEKKGLENAPVIGGLASRFSLGLRHLVMGIIIIVLVVMFASFAGMYAKTKSSADHAIAQAIKGDKMDQTCFSKMCLESTGFVLASMNLSVDPCDNFYEYACGNYKLFNKVNADTSQHTIFTYMSKKNEEKLKTILESPVKRKTDWAAERKLKELFQSCMDDYTLEKLRGKPFIDQILAPLGGWYVLGNWDASTYSLNNMLKKVQSDFWTDAMFAFRVNVDFFQPTQTDIMIYPAGTSRHMYWFYYISPSATKIQNDYKKFMTRVANLMVRDSGLNISAQTQSQRVLQFVSDAFTVEANIARLALLTPWRSNPNADSQKISLDDLTRQTGNLIDWTQQATYLFDTSGITGRKKTIVFNLNYLKGLVNMIKGIPTANRARMIHNYLIWRVLENYVQDLSWEYVHANREVYVDRTGRTEFLGKARYCFNLMSRSMPEALGALYISDHFADQNKAKITDITKATRNALASMLAKTTWMDPETVAIAENKIKKASYKLGYPDFLTDTDKLDLMYQSVSINASDFFGNLLRINQYHKIAWNKELKNGEDRDQWYFKTYDTNMAIIFYWNEVVVPAGLLQFPLYDYTLPHYYTFGGIGTFLGHFLLHIVSEYGRNWDETGAYMGYKNEWWTNATMTAYENVRDCIVDTYNVSMGPFTAPDGSQVHLPFNSDRTAAWNMGVVSGIKLAYNAYHLWESQKGIEKMAPSGQGLTNDQMFFISFAQTNCYSRNTQTAYSRAKYGTLREDYVVNVAVSQLDEFSQAFSCPAKSKLNPPNKCTLY